MTSFFQEDLHSSDSEDDDYVPDAGEVSSDDEEEDPGLLDEEIETKKSSRKKQEVFDTKVEKNKTVHGSPSKEAEVDEKKRANDLFKSFLEEVEAEMKVKECGNKCGEENTSVKLESKIPEISAASNGHASNGYAANGNTSNGYAANGHTSNGYAANGHTSNGYAANGCVSKENKHEKNACELFDFAGETVAVSVKDGIKITTTESSSDSAVQEKNNHDKNVPDNSANRSSIVKPKGLQSVLGTILNKNKKLTTLEKTSLDWKKFKDEYGISEELESYNKGRGGFIERKRFLERSDVRSYEIERDMRMTKRKKNI